MVRASQAQLSCAGAPPALRQAWRQGRVAAYTLRRRIVAKTAARVYGPAAPFVDALTRSLGHYEARPTALLFLALPSLEHEADARSSDRA